MVAVATGRPRSRRPAGGRPGGRLQCRIDLSEFLDLAEEHTAIVSRDVGATRFLVATADRGTGRGLFTRGPRPDMRMLPAAVDRLTAAGARPSGCFVDVGANIGTTTITAVTVCGFATAVAVEPEETNARLIAATAALNGFSDRVRVVHAAALDHDRGASLRRHPVASTRHTVDPDGDVDVPSVTLDGLGIDATGMLWIDAEGSEGQVLAGARRLLEERPPILFEFNPQSLRAHGGLDEVLAVARGYPLVCAARSGEQVDLAQLAERLDGSGGKETRRTDILLAAPG